MWRGRAQPGRVVPRIGLRIRIACSSMKGFPMRTWARHFGLASVLVLGLSACGQEQKPSKPADLEALGSAFVERLAAEDFEAAVASFDDVMRTALPAAKLRQTWTSLIAQTGPFQKQLGVRTEKVGVFDVVFVTCEFAKARLDVKVVFNRETQITGLWFVPSRSAAAYEPAAYVKRDAFHEEDVTVGSGRWALPGTLSMPIGAGPFPAVVLVHGSGPHDRDETIGPNKPFRDLAWGLASRGIAVLRYEKRTKHHAAKLAALKEGLTAKAETIDDALAAVSLLRRTEGIDAKRIFVLGHSLGGALAPRIAKRDPQIAGLIIMAGPTRPLEDVILEQTEYAFSLDGRLSGQEKEQLEKLKQQVARAKAPNLSSGTPAAELPFGIAASYWLDLRGYDPAATAAALSGPMLILQGGRDYQVTMADLDGWKKALAGRQRVTFKVYPKLNHLFIAGEGKSTPAEYTKPGHVAEAVITDIAEWLSKQRSK